MALKTTRGDKAGPLKGRGAPSNVEGRYESVAREAFEDGWPREEEMPARLETVITPQAAKSIIARNESPDVPFEQSINPYSGCEHGCVYCYARPSHAYLGLSPGLDFETRIFAKTNAAELLRKELSAPGYRCSIISLGANTDPYQPAERELRITRSILEVLVEFQHPFTIVTKSALVVRDVDLIAPMAAKDLARVFLSVTNLDAELARRLEPRAAAPYRRLEAIRRLASAGVPCGVLVAPVIPFLNDGDLESILEAAAEAGASSAGYIVIRLPHELKGIFKDWLEHHYPLRAERIMARIRDLRGGRENDPRFGARMKGTGEYAELIRRRFERACRKLGLSEGGRTGLDTSAFRVPGQSTQLPLL
ncbi:MAG: PA0069 family radical SAM protein [Betaproteobacteria bacterium]|nr:PA0069 family radical SAM protein [Betaproteobacteria bacterium]